MRKKQNNLLPLDTIIQVIARKNGRVYRKEKTYLEALEMKKKKGYTYTFYQLGFSSYK